MHIKYIIITIINTYNWEWIESMKMINIQSGLLNKAARENNASLISYAATTITPLTEATNWDEGLRDKLMSEHVLRRGGMRAPEIPSWMTSRVLPCCEHDLVSSRSGSGIH